MIDAEEPDNSEVIVDEVRGFGIGMGNRVAQIRLAPPSTKTIITIGVAHLPETYGKQLVAQHK